MSVARRSLVIANWKMNVGRADARAFMRDLPSLIRSEDVDVGIAPSFLHLGEMTEVLREQAVRLFAQNCHRHSKGAHTGEVSVPMLKELGVDGVIVGHSERRHEFGESDEIIAEKVVTVIEAGMRLVLCVGETDEERVAGRTDEVVSRQLSSGLAGLGGAIADGAEVTVAYEPVWAIGTGQTATPEQAGAAMALCGREVKLALPRFGDAVRLLYGGSVTPKNAHELFSIAGVDGGLVGGASTDPERFAAIVGAARAD